MQEDLQKSRNQCMSCILKHENAMNIFYARCLLFARLVCVLISMNWIIHKKFKFMKWSKSRIYCLPSFAKCSEIYSEKTWRFYALEANKKCNWIIAKKTNLRSESNFMTPFRQFRIYLFSHLNRSRWLASVGHFHLTLTAIFPLLINSK